MNKLIFTLLLCACALRGFAQIRFEKGYFLNDDSLRTECWIKNVGWQFNPGKFAYRLSENGAVLTATLESVREFGTYGSGMKYVRAEVKIDRSPRDLSFLDGDAQPKFAVERLFLKVLVEGTAAALYLYESAGLTRFFYETPAVPLEQLVYKRYRQDATRYGENRQYRQQLFLNANCGNAPLKNFEALRYVEPELIRFFEKYNRCKNKSVQVMRNPRYRPLNLALKAGASYTDLSLAVFFLDDPVDFSAKLNYRLAAAAEYTLPFWQNKWTIFAEAAYQSYRAHKVVSYDGVIPSTDSVGVKYQTLEMPIGVKYDFFLGEKAQLNLHAAYVLDFPIDPLINYDDQQTLLILPGYSVCVGLGYSHGRLGAEIRYYTPQRIVNAFMWDSAYGRANVVFVYRLFKPNKSPRNPSATAQSSKN